MIFHGGKKLQLKIMLMGMIIFINISFSDPGLSLCRNWYDFPSICSHAY